MIHSRGCWCTWEGGAQWEGIGAHGGWCAWGLMCMCDDTKWGVLMRMGDGAHGGMIHSGGVDACGGCVWSLVCMGG